MKDLKRRFPLEFPQMLLIEKQLKDNPFLTLKQARRLFKMIRNGKARRAFYRCQGYTWWQINRVKVGWAAAGVVVGGVGAYALTPKKTTNGDGFGHTGE
jgi:hypothetical protein